MFTRKKILLVMKDKDLLSEFIDILVHYTTAYIFQSPGGVEALYAVKRFQPDLVILQMSLPDVELSLLIKSILNLSDIEGHRPCIVGALEDSNMTSYAKGYYSHLAVDGTLTYPVNKKDLERHVREACPEIDWQQEEVA